MQELADCMAGIEEREHRKYPSSAETSRLLSTIEESQFGYRYTLQGPYGPRRGEL